MSLTKRNIGLDYFRALAIFFVLISHSRHLFTYIDDINWWLLSVGGYLGVELFFVLSGFLIGKILIEEVLLAWKHLFFLQNFTSEGLNFFAVSWSLSVEEWFYFCVPVILMIMMSLIGKTNGQNIFLSIIFLLIMIMIIKIILVYIYPEWSWTDVRKNVFLRFDSLLIGVMVAYIQNYHRRIFNTLGDKRVFVSSIFFMMAMVAWYYNKGDSGLNIDFFSKSFMFPITSILLSMIMIYFYFHIKKESILSIYGSRLAYSIYLIHFLFLDFFIKFSHKYNNPYLSICFLLSFLCLTILVSYVLYRYYELPMMNLRERFVSN